MGLEKWIKLSSPPFGTLNFLCGKILQRGNCEAALYKRELTVSCQRKGNIRNRYLMGFGMNLCSVMGTEWKSEARRNQIIEKKDK